MVNKMSVSVMNWYAECHTGRRLDWVLAPKSELYSHHQASGKFFVRLHGQSPYGRYHGPPLLLRTLYVVTIVILGASSIHAQATAQGTTLTSMAKAWNVSFSDWDQSSDPCVGNWSGVTCDTTRSRVIKLNLTDKSLQGPIPSEIAQLIYLQELILDKNNIQSPIPNEIGQLNHLERLSLNANNLTSLPPDVLLQCNLTYLAMNNNSISGQLPTWIGQLSTLTKLDFNTNLLWGGLPPEYGKLTNMISMQLWGNTLSGFLPDEWKAMTKMNNYGMGHLFLTGPIPEWLFELPNLRIMHFMRNQFVGSFPNVTKLLQNGIANLTNVDFSCNFLNGTDPQLNFNRLSTPNTSVDYYSNCYSDQIDGSATISSSKNATENTPTNCSRQLNCDDFHTQIARMPGSCAPCPSSFDQVLIDVTNCVCGQDLDQHGGKTGSVVGGIVGGACTTIILIVLIFLYYKKSQRIKYPEFGRRLEGINEPWYVPKDLRRFTLQELEKATEYFNDKHYIGSGGFGKVYRGVVNDGTIVAIKCASLHSAQGQPEFRNELALLSRLHHRHLVGLEGFCDEGGLQVLVYEFMENGDLADNLHGKDGRSQLDSYQRLEVALGIARGLDYLHYSANPPVIHRDIKPSNVLLNHYMIAKVADFGISKVSPELHTHVSTRPLGTAGYLDPDYFKTNQLTTGSDVYAFGMVLLEIITGQRVIDPMRLEALSLCEWVKPRYKRGGIKDIIDRKLEADYDENVYTLLTDIALRCTAPDRIDRPSMKEVLTTMEPYAKSPKEIHVEPEWSISYFRNKSLFEPDAGFNPLDDLPRPTASPSFNHKSNDPSGSSTDTSKANTTAFDAFTALQPR